MLPKISVVISADTDSAEAGLNRTEQRIDSLGGAADRASTRVGRMSGQVNAAVRPTRNYGFAVQNASFQAADFAVQVQGGVDASRALAQQLPQLLGGFGILGAVMGAVVAVGIPLGVAFANMAENGNDVSHMLGVLQPAFEQIGDIMRSVASAAVTFADVVVNNLDRIIITAGVAAAAFGAKMVGGFIAARLATMTLAGALVALRGALIRTGIGALIVAAGELVYQFTRLVTAAGSFGNALSLLKDVAVEVFERIKIAFAIVPAAVQAGAANMHRWFVASLVDMTQAFQDFTWSVANGLNSIFGGNLTGANLTGSITSLGVAFTSAAHAATAANEELIGLNEGLTAPLESVAALRAAMSGLNDERVNLSDLFGGGGEDDEEGGEGGKSAATKALEGELTAQEERIKEHFDRIKALTVGSLSDKSGAWSDYFSNLASLTGSSNDKLLKISKAFGAQMALIDAWRAHNAVLADPTLPWWARIASAGAVFAAGLGAVNAIKGSGSSGSSGSAASTASTSSTSSSSGSNLLNVSLTNLASDGLYSGSDISSLFDSLGDEAKARGFEGVRFT